VSGADEGGTGDREVLAALGVSEGSASTTTSRITFHRIDTINAVAIWTSSDGTFDSVWSSRFE